MPATMNIGRENENRYRSYPFSESCRPVDTEGVPLDDDVLVDAFLLVRGKTCPVRMSLLDFSSNMVEFSCGGVAVASGSFTPDSTSASLLQNGKPAGTVVFGPGLAREAASGRRREFGETALLCASCVASVNPKVVSSVSIQGRSVSASAPVVEFTESSGGRLIPRAEKRSDGDFDLWFDVVSKFEVSERFVDSGIRRIVVVSDSGSLFSADEGDIAGESVYVSIPTMSREDVCARVHLADDIMQVSDTCLADEPEPCNPDSLPVKEESSVDMSGCSVNFMAYDLADYRNPVKFDVVFGTRLSTGAAAVKKGASVNEVSDAVVAASSSSAAPGNGIEISIPGVAHA